MNGCVLRLGVVFGSAPMLLGLVGILFGTGERDHMLVSVTLIIVGMIIMMLAAGIGWALSALK